MSPELQNYLLVAVVVAIAATLQGSTGIGFNMFAAPIVALIEPAFLPGPLLLLAAMVSLGVMLREFRAIDVRGVCYSLAGRLPASFLAGYSMALAPPSGFAFFFSALVLAAVGVSIAGGTVHPSRKNLLLAGVASGYMGTITSIGAPPMALIYQHSPGPRVRATISAFFVVGVVFSLGALATFGHFGAAHVIMSLQLIPSLLIGFLVSGPMARFVDKGRVRVAVLSISTLSALVLLGGQVIF